MLELEFDKLRVEFESKEESQTSKEVEEKAETMEVDLELGIGKIRKIDSSNTQ